ncbi:4'-phosphopantetheinyl transferase family protein [Haemophilus paracuniculus]|uniref:4'-phosphopantetheinyl transferase family protein n=1 Tax=Haemophilus paracuniculus TaxID=734 RepID=UPI00117A0455|nr:4'-phosphopantetheinyl transferase superfamily protein [Haemophilus paracuniculus]
MEKSYPLQGTVEVVFAHNDEPISADFDYPPMPNQLAPHQINKWKSRRMANFLLGQLFQKYQIPLAQLSEIKRTESGRPFIQNPQVDFNISHSGEWVAVIFCWSEQPKKVGIDIEHPLKTRRYQNLIEYYANQTEKDYFLASEKLSQNKLKNDFYLSWCLREAVLKSQGVGIIKLSEVKHFPQQQTIYSDYCPKGYFHFYDNFPFYLGYFYQQGLLQAKLSQWQNHQFNLIENELPLIYQVN